MEQINLEQREQTRPSVSRAGERTSGYPESERLADAVIAEAKRTAPDARFTRKDKNEIRTVIADRRGTSGELTTAVRSIIAGLDEWALRRAGDTVATELGPTVDAQRKAAQERVTTEQIMTKQRIAIQSETALEIAASEAEIQREDELASEEAERFGNDAGDWLTELNAR
jgi:hypothetical protein